MRASHHGADRRLTEGPIAATLARFSLPLLTTNFMHSLAGTWSAIWVSHALGADALTAVGNANIFMYMMMGAVTGVGLAAGIAIGQARGLGDVEAIKRIVGTAIAFVLGMSMLIGAIGYGHTGQILDLIHTPDSARADAQTFLKLTCVSMPSIFTFIFMLMMLRGSGDARTPFRFTVLWIALALVLSPMLITGSAGLPRLGIAGAALGNLIANALSLVAMVAYVYHRNLPVALRGRALRHLWPQWSLLAMLVRRGVPMAIEAFVVQGSYFVLLAMVNAHGAVTASAYSAAAQLWAYVQMPALALASSMAAMAAINIGAGQWARVERIALVGCCLSGVMTLLCTALVYAAGDAPLRLFLPAGGPALEIARDINHIVLWGWIAMCVTSSLCAIVRANAAMLAPTLIFAVTMWVIRVPFAKALHPWLGAEAIWWSFPAGAISSALLAFLYYRHGRWRSNRLLVGGA